MLSRNITITSIPYLLGFDHMQVLFFCDSANSAKDAARVAV
jgi:hypothetical protein